MAENVVLKLDNVSKSFAKVEKDEITHALGNINLEMRSGEFISLVGTSGCGKSTILRLIAGLITPTMGRLTVNDQEITGPDPERGMVFQRPTLFPWLTVEKNIAFSLKMQNKLKGNEDKVERMLRLIGLEDFKDDYPGQLSGGMAQRVALDAFTRMNMQDEILSAWKERKQLAIMVTHDVDEAIYMGTRVIVMEANPGRIKADIPLTMDYPRNRSSSQFVAYRNQILEMLNYGAKE